MKGYNDIYQDHIFIKREIFKITNAMHSYKNHGRDNIL